MAVTEKPSDQDFEFETPSEQFWRCEECGEKDLKKKLPNRDAWLRSKMTPLRCRRCGSLGLMPVGL
jgi:DNA-directed RNA polymerase subunit RPC12/RpoP